MDTVVLQRDSSSDEGTFGVLTLPGGWSCHTLELPWRENARQISCIPAGSYKTVLHRSPKFGLVYWVQEVPNRSGILIHAGNLAGDRSKGLRSDVEGCILVGKTRGRLSGQAAVLSSKVALGEFMKNMNRRSVVLEVRDAA